MPSILKKIKPKMGWLSKPAKEQDAKPTGNNDNRSQTTASSSKTGGSSRRRRSSGTASQEATGSNSNKKTSSDRFLLESPVLNPVALLNRREVQVGKLLGEGGFCEVLEVTGFRLAPPSNEAMPIPSTCQEGMQQRRRERRRQDLAKSSVTLENGMPRYVLKQVSTKLLLIPGGLHQASIDLVTEANYLIRLDHPHILKVHAMALDGRTAFENKTYDDLFLVADRLSTTLRKRIDGWKYNGSVHAKTDTNVLVHKTNYALQIASALEYLHERRLIYRDLKPENIGFLPSSNHHDKPRTLQLFDFGLCRELPEETPESDNKEFFRMSSVGTPAYMAPEVNSGGYNTKADIFSFSCLFYELLMLKHPMKRGRFQSRQAKAAKGDRPDLTKSGLPDSIQELLCATWHQSVAERLDSRQTRLRLENILSELGGDEKRSSSLSFE